MLRFFHIMIAIIALLIIGSGIFTYLNSQRDTIYIGVDGYSPPFSLTTRNGDLSGYGIDIIRAIGNAVNLDVEFRIIPFNALHDSLRKGTVDAVIAPFDPELPLNKLNSIFTDPYYVNNFVYVTLESSYVHDLARKSAAGLKICTTDKPELLKFLRVHFSYETIMIYENLAAAYTALYRNNCDIIADSKSSATYYIKKHSFRKLRVNDLKKDNQMKYRVAFALNRYDLRDMFNQGLNYIVQTREIDRIDNKWFGTKSEILSDINL